MPLLRTLLEVALTSKLLAIDGLATSSISLGEVATLKHELGNDAMEGRASISKTMFTGAQLAEVFRGLRYIFIIELEDDAPSVLAADTDVEL